jgi:hypothetical protein
MEVHIPDRTQHPEQQHVSFIHQSYLSGAMSLKIGPLATFMNHSGVRMTLVRFVKKETVSFCLFFGIANTVQMQNVPM